MTIKTEYICDGCGSTSYNPQDVFGFIFEDKDTSSLHIILEINSDAFSTHICKKCMAGSLKIIKMKQENKDDSVPEYVEDIGIDNHPDFPDEDK